MIVGLEFDEVVSSVVLTQIHDFIISFGFAGLAITALVLAFFWVRTLFTGTGGGIVAPVEIEGFVVSSFQTRREDGGRVTYQRKGGRS
jgi:hypothetical protein